MDPEWREQERSMSYAGLVRAVQQAFETMSEHPSSCLTNSTKMTLNGVSSCWSLKLSTCSNPYDDLFKTGWWQPGPTAQASMSAQSQSPTEENLLEFIMMSTDSPLQSSFVRVTPGKLGMWINSL